MILVGGHTRSQSDRPWPSSSAGTAQDSSRIGRRPCAAIQGGVLAATSRSAAARVTPLSWASKPGGCSQDHREEHTIDQAAQTFSTPKTTSRGDRHVLQGAREQSRYNKRWPIDLTASSRAAWHAAVESRSTSMPRHPQVSAKTEPQGRKSKAMPVGPFEDEIRAWWRMPNRSEEDKRFHNWSAPATMPTH